MSLSQQSKNRIVDAVRQHFGNDYPPPAKLTLWLSEFVERFLPQAAAPPGAAPATYAEVTGAAIAAAYGPSDRGVVPDATLAQLLATVPLAVGIDQISIERAMVFGHPG